MLANPGHMRDRNLPGPEIVYTWRVARYPIPFQGAVPDARVQYFHERRRP